MAQIPHDLYGAGVLHLAWAVEGGRRHHVFGYVELLPQEVPAPPHDGEATSGRLQGKSKYRLYSQHVPLTASRALQWYLDCASGIAIRPREDGTIEPSGSASAVRLQTPSFAAEPQWPGLATAVLGGRRPPVPFLARWHGSARLHHLMSPGFEVEQLFTPREERQVVDWVAEQLLVPLDEWPRLWGTMHLVVPNPYHRAVEERLTSAAGAAEAVEVQVRPRAGVAQPTLDVSVGDMRPTGVSEVKTTQLDGVSASIPLGGDLQKTWLLVSVDGDVLHCHAPSYFLRGVSVGLDVVDFTREVHVPTADGREAERYQVAQVSSMSPERRVARTAVSDFVEMTALAKTRHLAESLEQRWFREELQAAVELIRELVGRARKEILFADPYFTQTELRRFALATTSSNVPIRILTSSRAFGRETGHASPEEFHADLQSLAKQARVNPLEVRVMGPSDLHDRLLVIDKQLFSLGASFNEFGRRGTLLIRVPETRTIIGDLHTIWSSSRSLEEWLKARSSAPGRWSRIKVSVKKCWKEVVAALKDRE